MTNPGTLRAYSFCDYLKVNIEKHETAADIKPLACHINYRLRNFSFASFFKMLQCCLKLVKCCLSVKQLGSGLDAEISGVSSRSNMFACGTTVVLGGLYWALRVSCYIIMPCNFERRIVSTKSQFGCCF